MCIRDRAKMNQFIFDDNLKNVNEVKNIDIIFFSVSKRELLNKEDVYKRQIKNRNTGI